MSKRTLVDVDILSSNKKGFDSSLTTSILTSNSSGLVSTLGTTLGIMAALMGPKPIKGFARMAIKIISDILKGLVNTIILAKNIFDSIIKGIANVFKGIGWVLKKLWKIGGALAGLFPKAYKFFKKYKFKGFSVLWETTKKLFNDKIARWGIDIVIKKNKIVSAVIKDFKIISGAFKEYGAFISKKWGNVKTFINNTLNYIKANSKLNVIKKVGTTIASSVNSIANGFVKRMKKSIANFFDALKTKLGNPKLNLIKGKSIGKLDSYSFLAKADKSGKLVKVLDDAVKNTKKVNSIKDAAKILDDVEKVSTEIASKSKYFKSLKAFGASMSVVDFIGEGVGFVVGSVADTYLIHEEGRGWIEAGAVSILSNAAGSLSGMVVDALGWILAVPTGGVAKAVSIGASVAVDAYVTDLIQSIIYPKTHSWNDTYTSAITLLKLAGSMGKDLASTLFDKAITIGKNALGIVEFENDKGLMANNLLGITDKAKTEPIFMGYLTKLISKTSIIPGIRSMDAKITMDGEDVTPDMDDMTIDDTTEEQEGEPLTDISIPHPGYMLEAFFKNNKTILTHDSIKQIHSKYEGFKSILSVYSSELRTELQSLKSEYSSL